MVTAWAMPVAPGAPPWPIKPPERLTGSRPSRLNAPSARAGAAPPGDARPSASRLWISAPVKGSQTSATSMSWAASSMPAMA